MERPLTQNIRSNAEPLNLAEYEKAGGYESVRVALRQFSPQAVQKLVSDSTLRGRGGAGFPTGQKWSFVPMGPEAPRPKYLVVNADEMEPGTFKDRILLEGDPHQMIESMIVAAYAIDADTGYIFLRWEYTLAAARLRKAIAEARAHGYLGRNILGSDFSFEAHLHTSAGRYICGEETALLNSLEGKRAIPRAKPPYPQVSGLWGKPTIVQNVETLYNVPHIVTHGADWYRRLSRGKDGGTKLYGVSGKVNQPGAWELPMGTPIREILEQHAGGMREGVRFRALIPGGASTAFLLDQHLDLPMDFTSLPEAGSRMGTGTMIIMDDATCPVGLLANLEHFFAQESCGWCTPCREGLPWTRQILHAIENGDGRPEDL
ncbi:MAG TPA: NADH-ubiquinone oxidoreductase-F iron-sulfur binding region domain-containing protein, partial [Nitrospiraceae bacterium]|nr:NADH-ubiquinone oxidoreductase-F iron-sulfur binding region domain-containing protein [Nitrospiraceae bacterium]